MNTFNFDILRKNGSTFEYTGVTFSDKRAVDVYLDKFIKKSEREHYYIKSCRADQDNSNVYGSIEELLIKQPAKEIDLLEVEKDNMQRRIYLPFSLMIESNKRIKKCYHMTFEDIENILNYVEQNGKIDKNSDKKLFFMLDKVKDYEHRIILGEISIEEYEHLKELKQEIVKKVSIIDKKINSIKENLEGRDID